MAGILLEQLVVPREIPDLADVVEPYGVLGKPAALDQRLDLHVPGRERHDFIADVLQALVQGLDLKSGQYPLSEQKPLIVEPFDLVLRQWHG